MIDRLASLIDGTTTDARAGEDSGSDGGPSVGTCCTPAPSGPVQIVPASENSAQLLTGSVPTISSTGTLVVNGPFVLTDAAVGLGNGYPAGLVLEPSAATCTATAGAFPDPLPGFLLDVTPSVPLHGGRYLVPSGKMLCALYATPYPASPSGENAPALQWAGFRPYQ
jgi:hypothetical protein